MLWLSCHIRSSVPFECWGDCNDPDIQEQKKLKTKRYLLETLERELAPIRERRLEYAKDMGEVFNMLEKGSQAAREVAGQTLAEVKAAMGINYF